MPMISWFDAHNHLQDPRLGDDLEKIIATSQRAGISGCMVNATCEPDWPRVETLANRYPGWAIPTFGVHPWHAATAADGWQFRLRNLLVAHPRAGIGECGLDRHPSNPATDVQMAVFLEQLRLAQELDRFVSIHCHKAWGLLLEALETVRTARFMVHAFSGSVEMARQLATMGGYLSISGNVLAPQSWRMRETLKWLPADRLLVETDAPNQVPPAEIIHHPLPRNLNHPANLPCIGEGLSPVFGMSPGELASLTRQNSHNLCRNGVG